MNIFKWYLGILLVMPLASKAQTKVKIVCHDYIPYYNKDAKGMLIELYDAAFKEVGVSVDFKCLPVKRSVAQFLEGKFDAHSPGSIFIPDEHKSKIEQVNTIKVPVGFAYSKKNLPRGKDIDSFEKIKTEKVAAISNSPLTPFYKKHGIKVSNLEKPSLMVVMMSKERVSLAEVTDMAGLMLLKKTFPKNYLNYDLTPPVLAVDVGLSFRKDTEKSKNLHKKYLEGLNRIVKNGRYFEILERYYGTGNIPQEAVYWQKKGRTVSALDTKKFQSFSRSPIGFIKK